MTLGVTRGQRAEEGRSGRHCQSSHIALRLLQRNWAGIRPTVERVAGHTHCGDAQAIQRVEAFAHGTPSVAELAAIAPCRDDARRLMRGPPQPQICLGTHRIFGPQ